MFFHRSKNKLKIKSRIAGRKPTLKSELWIIIF